MNYKPNFDLTELLKEWEKPKSNQIKKLYETLTQKSLSFTNEQDNEEMSPLNVYNTFIESETIKKTTTPKKNTSKKVVYVKQNQLELELCKLVFL